MKRKDSEMIPGCFSNAQRICYSRKDFKRFPDVYSNDKVLSQAYIISKYPLWLSKV